MSETAQKPAIRFRGFTDPWEQRKVGDHLIESKTKGHTGNSARKITVKLWGKGVVEKNDFGGSEHTQYYERKSGQFIYSKLDFLNAAFGVIPEKLDKYESTADLPAFDPVEINPHFMCFRAIQKDFYLKNGMIADGSRKAKRIHVNVFQAMPISVPSLDEQDKIVTFLQAIDNLITLHQRKYEKLVDVKKALLEKMFPADGENVPQIRFRGFTDPWEQRKLSDYLEVSNEKNLDNVYSIFDVLSVSGDYGVVNQIEFQGRSFAGASVTNYGVARTLHVIYTKSPLKANPYGIIKTNKGKTGIVSVLYGIFTPKDNVYSPFIQNYFEQDARLNNYLQPLVNKGAKNTLLISDEDSLQGYVNFAPSYNEQKTIGELFDNLDNLITLHQRKLEKLKNIKKALLDKMFV